MSLTPDAKRAIAAARKVLRIPESATIDDVLIKRVARDLKIVSPAFSRPYSASPSKHRVSAVSAAPNKRKAPSAASARAKKRSKRRVSSASQWDAEPEDEETREDDSRMTKAGVSHTLQLQPGPLTGL